MIELISLSPSFLTSGPTDSTVLRPVEACIHAPIQLYCNFKSTQNVKHIKVIIFAINSWITLPGLKPMSVLWTHSGQWSCTQHFLGPSFLNEHCVFNAEYGVWRSRPDYVRVIYILNAATDGCRSRPFLACPPLHGASNCRCSQTLAPFFSHCSAGNFVNTPVHVNKTTPRR